MPRFENQNDVSTVKPISSHWVFHQGASPVPRSLTKMVLHLRKFVIFLLCLKLFVR